MPENSTNRGYPLPVAGDAFTPQAGANALGVAVDADVQGVVDSLSTVATTGAYGDLSGLPTLGTAAATDASAYASSAQGALADSAVQPGDLATVATTGAYGDLSGLPTLGTAAGQNVEAFADAAQGVKADAAAPAATIGNLLTAAESNAVAANWQGARVDCTVTDATSTVAPYVGTHTFAMARSASPSFTAMYTTQGTAPSTTYGAPVTAGSLVTCSYWVRADAANAVTCSASVQVVFRRADGTIVSTSTGGTTETSAAEWRLITHTVTVPATATIAQLRVYMFDLGASHVVYASGVGVWRGAGGTWAPPGVVINDAPARVKPTDAAVMQLWNPSTSSWVDAAASSSVVFGTTSGTAAEGDDVRIVNAVQNTRQVATGSGLTGGGDLTADRTLAVDFTAVATAAQGAAAEKVEIGVACSDETTDLATGTAKVTFRLPHALTLTAVRASVTTAPVGSALTVDINAGGASVLSTLLTIDAGEKTSTTAATPAVVGTSALADDAEITVDIDAVGSSTAGAGLKVWLIGTRA